MTDGKHNPPDAWRKIVLESALDAVVGIDEHGTITDWNAQATSIFGWNREETLGRLLHELIIPPDWREGHLRGMRHWHATGEGPILNRRIEVVALHRNGTIFPVELTVIPVQENGGHVFYSFVRDISDRKRAESAIRASESQLRLITNSLPALVAYLTTDLRYRFVNTAYHTWFGQQADEVAGRSMRDILGDAVFEKIRPYLDKALAGQPVTFETDLPYKDGPTRYVHASYTPDFDDNGKVRGIVVLVQDLTSRREKEHALAASEQRFRTHYEQAPFSIQLFAPDGRTVAVNQAWKDLWGVPEEVIQNYILKEYNVLKDHQLVARGVMPHIKKGFAGEAARIPAILYDPAEMGVVGEPRWVGAYLYPVKDPSGKIVELVLVHDDVTQQRKVEEELRRSRDQLRVIFDGVADGILVQDRNYRCVYANDIGARLCGYRSAREFEGTDLSALIPKLEIRDEQGNPFPVERLPARLAFSGVKDPPETVMQFRNLVTGEMNWSVVKARPIVDVDGRTDLVVSIFRNITMQKREQERRAFLAEAAKLLSSSLDYNETLQNLAKVITPDIADWCSIDVLEEQGPRSVAVAHPDPRMLAWGAEYRAKYPVDWSAPHGAPNVIRTGRSELYSTITAEDLRRGARDAHHLELLLQLGMKSILVVPLRAHDRVLGALSLISTQAGRHYTAEDQAFAEELGRMAGTAIENAQHFRRSQEAIRARDEFLSIASHELKTPLTSLKLHTQLVERKLDRGMAEATDPEAMAKFVRSSLRQLDRLVKLVDDMLDISRIAHGKLSLEREPVDLSALLRDVLDRFYGQLVAAGCVPTLSSPEPIRGSWDRYRIEQVVANLLTNAMKYGAANPVEISAAQENGKAVVRVRDHGRGIAPENLDKIFQRFERVVTASEVSGLGLGLYISRQIAEAHGGRLYATSELGKGSTFALELPLG